MINPYYEKNGITIYHGDSREVLPELEVADMVFTDPPYGVDYDGGTFSKKRDKLADDNTDIFHWFMPLLAKAVKGPCYICHAGTRAGFLWDAMGDDWTVHALIIWYKTNAAYPSMHKAYKQAHEPILYCKPKGSTLRWCGPTTECTVWHMPRHTRSDYHPTQKPVWLSTRALRNHKANLVIDPFMGGGSTLIAAKQLGRRAIGIEIEEKYCEVAAKRLDEPTLGVMSVKKRTKLCNLGLKTKKKK